MSNLNSNDDICEHCAVKAGLWVRHKSIYSWYSSHSDRKISCCVCGTTNSKFIQLFCLEPKELATGELNDD